MKSSFAFSLPAASRLASLDTKRRISFSKVGIRLTRVSRSLDFFRRVLVSSSSAICCRRDSLSAPDHADVLVFLNELGTEAEDFFFKRLSSLFFFGVLDFEDFVEALGVIDQLLEGWFVAF